LNGGTRGAIVRVLVPFDLDRPYLAIGMVTEVGELCLSKGQPLN